MRAKVGCEGEDEGEGEGDSGQSNRWHDESEGACLFGVWRQLVEELLDRGGERGGARREERVLVLGVEQYAALATLDRRGDVVEEDLELSAEQRNVRPA